MKEKPQNRIVHGLSESLPPLDKETFYSAGRDYDIQNDLTLKILNPKIYDGLIDKNESLNKLIEPVLKKILDLRNELVMVNQKVVDNIKTIEDYEKKIDMMTSQSDEDFNNLPAQFKENLLDKAEKLIKYRENVADEITDLLTQAQQLKAELKKVEHLDKIWEKFGNN